MTGQSLYESFTREVGGAYTLPWEGLPSIARTAWEHAANTLVTENESLRADVEYARRQREEFAKQNDELRAEVLRLKEATGHPNLGRWLLCPSCDMQYRTFDAPCPNCRSTTARTIIE